MSIIEVPSNIFHYSSFLVDNAILPVFCADYQGHQNAVGDKVFEQFLKLSSAVQVTEGTINVYYFFFYILYFPPKICYINIIILFYYRIKQFWLDPIPTC